MTVLLELEGVSKFYGALKAVDGVKLGVDDGEALGVIGPNGAGKSTMFNLITGDAAPSAGRVLFGGSDMTTMPPHARSRMGIGRSYQIPHPFANMTVFENLLVGAIFGGRNSERESYNRCSEVLKITGLYDKANKPARTLTLLQRKRLELARALAMQPKLLLLDEIAGGLTEHECGELVEDHQGNPRQRHDDRVDRAHRACACFGDEPAGGDEFRSGSGGGRSPRGHG